MMINIPALMFSLAVGSIYYYVVVLRPRENKQPQPTLDLKPEDEITQCEKS